MAIFYFNAAVVSRGKAGNTVKSAAHHSGKSTAAKGGKSALDSAAYNARTTLTDEKTGERFDYTQRFGGAGSEIRLPEGAQPWMADRQKLWNAIERIENRKDSQLARNFIISLPYELSRDQRRQALREFVDTHFVQKGKPVDIGYHDYGDPYPANSPVIGNYLSEWRSKGYAFYERNDLPISDTKPHIAIVRDAKGQIEGYSVYQPHAHAMVPFRSVDPHFKTGFTRLKDRAPGDEHPAAYWESELRRLREAWAGTLNRHLEIAGRPERVSHLSLKDQGIRDRKPEPKKGPLATKMEREGRGDESNAVRDWRRVRDENAELKGLAGQLLNIQSEIVYLEGRRRKQPMDAEQTGSRKLSEDQDAKYREVLETKERTDAFFRQWDADRKQSERDEKERAENQRTRERLGEIDDPKSRFAEAMRRYDGSPESALQVFADEYARYRESQDTLKEKIAASDSPEERKKLQLRHDIQEADYHEIVNQRTAGMNYVIDGKKGFVMNEQGQSVPSAHQQDWIAANYWHAKGEALREQYSDHDRAMREQFIDTYKQQKPANEPATPVEAKAEESVAMRAVREAEQHMTPDQAAAEQRRQERSEHVRTERAQRDSVEEGVAYSRAQARGGISF